MRLYIIRHGDPDYEHNTITEAGHLEAQALAKRMAGIGLDRIFCSPFGRALDTMRYTTDLTGLNYTIEDWMREMYPELWVKGTPWEDAPLFEYPGEVFRSGTNLPTHATWHHLEFLKDSGVSEAVEAIRSHSDTFLKKLGYERAGGLYKCIASNQEKIAVFCHAGLALTWLSCLLEIPASLVWSGFWLPPTSVTTVLFEERSKEWAVPRCIGVGDVSHIYTAGLPESRRGLRGNIL